MRNQAREKVAITAAEFIINMCPEFSPNDCPIGLILGTGWGDVLEINYAQEIPLMAIPGFSNLETLEGHKRSLIIGYVEGKRVLVLSGRIHLNEAPCDQNLVKMVRLQTEMLFQLGVKTLITTSAVGSLNSSICVGDVTIIDGLVTLFAPEMPLWAGEFISPEDTINQELINIAQEESGSIRTSTAGHAMVRGPFFEGRKYDKNILADTGAKVVGMSILPDACVTALYGAKMLALCFVTNNTFSIHSHEENVVRARKSSGLLGQYLVKIIKRIN